MPEANKPGVDPRPHHDREEWRKRMISSSEDKNVTIVARLTLISRGKTAQHTVSHFAACCKSEQMKAKHQIDELKRVENHRAVGQTANT